MKTALPRYATSPHFRKPPDENEATMNSIWQEFLGAPVVHTSASGSWLWIFVTRRQNWPQRVTATIVSPLRHLGLTRSQRGLMARIVSASSTDQRRQPPGR
jgi:hypothetical protein